MSVGADDNATNKNNYDNNVACSIGEAETMLAAMDLENCKPPYD